MYRLTLYCLIALLIVAGVISFFGVLPFTYLQLICSTLFILVVGLIANFILSRIFGIPTNFESVYITSLILALIITPATDFSGYMFLFWASIIAIASKFLLGLWGKHLFNPAAIAVVVTSYVINQGASWWVGNQWMFAIVLICGFLIVRKIRRWDMVYAFIFVTAAVTYFIAINHGSNLLTLTKALFLSSPLIFFATVMLTEPLTTPPTKSLQVLYGGLVGFLFAPFTHIGSFYFTPELALVFGNVFSYLVSPKLRLGLILQKREQIGHDLYDFVFTSEHKLNFHPGQYLEWTLNNKTDSRGNRRYFTISSSPTEPEIRMGVKFYPNPSNFKKTLLELNTGSKIFAGQLAGDFTLPKDPAEKLVFLAGGIGITPYRSMIKYLVDKKENRDVTLFYSNRTWEEVVYTDVLNQAYETLGVKTICTLTDEIPDDWQGERGRIDAAMITRYVPDYQTRTFYISGTHAMVTSMEDLLRSMGVSKKRIKTDFFPGFA